MINFLIGMKKKLIVKYEIFWLLEHLSLRLVGKRFFKKSRDTIHLAIEKSIGSMVSTLDVPILESNQIKEINQSIKKRIPFVIKKSALNKALMTQVSLSSLERDHGKDLQPVFTDYNDDQEVVLKSVNDILKNLKEGSKEKVLFGDLFDKDLYIKKFTKDLFFGNLSLYKNSLLKKVHLFISPKESITSFHAEFGDALIVQLEGRKIWTIYEPKYASVFKPLVLGLEFFQSSKRFESMKANKIIHNLPHYQVTLEPGDILYNPSLHWHSVESIGETVSLSFRFSRVSSILKNLRQSIILISSNNVKFKELLFNSKRTYPKKFTSKS